MKYELSIIFYGVDKPELVTSYDYLINDIFSNYQKIECNFINVGQEELIDTSYDVFVYHCADPGRRMHFGFAPTYEQVKSAILQIKPKIIIQLADEFHTETNEIHNLFSNICNLFLREHRHKSQLYTYEENIINIPLGYWNGFLNNKTKEFKKPIERKYNWSWVGSLKKDRYHMIYNFWYIWKNIVVTNAYLHPSEIYEIYSDSIFVPCGKGNFSLDCYRLYEATRSGAIPVVVGQSEEIEVIFSFFGKIPPWIFAQTWEDAVSKCQEIEGNFEKLEEMQTENTFWWNDTIRKLQFKIQEALEKDLCDYEVGLNKILEKEDNVEKPKQLIWYCPEQIKHTDENVLEKSAYYM